MIILTTLPDITFEYYWPEKIVPSQVAVSYLGVI